MQTDPQAIDEILEPLPFHPLPSAAEFAVCPKHGASFPRSLLIHGAEFPNRCPTCIAEELAGASSRDNAALRAAREALEVERKREALAKRWEQALIPSRFAEYTLDTFPLPKVGERGAEAARTALAQCRTYLARWSEHRRRGGNLILVGPPGTGKTGLACGVANAIVRTHNGTALYQSAYGIVRHQRDTWGRKGKTETQALQDLLAPDLLLVDEVGVQLGTEAEMNLLFEVLNGRYAERRPALIVSNLPVQAWTDATGNSRPGLRSFLGQRLWDRLQDDGSAVVRCDWQSLRGGAA